MNTPNPLSNPSDDQSKLVGSTSVASNDRASFENAANASRPTIIREFYDFLIAYSVWWLTPIFLALILLAGMVFLGGSAAAPFIYPLF